MRTQLRLIVGLATLLVTTLSFAPADAACPAGSARQVQEPGAGPLAFVLPTLAPGAQRAVLSVTHGSVVLTASQFAWTPQPSFWTVGTSTVTLRTWTATSSSIASYLILAGGHTPSPTVLSFDESVQPGAWTVNTSGVGGALVDEVAAFEGHLGLRFASPGNGTPAIEGTLLTNDLNGDTRGGRTGRTSFQGPPPTVAPGNLLTTPLTLLSSGPATNPHFEVLLDRNTGLSLQLRDPRTNQATGWRTLSSSPHHLELITWLDAPGAPAGAMLLVDEAHFLSLESSATVPSGEVLPRLRVGSAGATSPLGVYDVDEIQLGWFQDARLACQAAADYESEGIVPPFTTFQSSYLTLGAAGALAGNQGLSIALDVPLSGGAVQYPVPVGTTVRRQGLRFRFDPNSTVMPLGGSPINLVDSVTSIAGGRPFRVQLVKTTSGYGIAVRARSGDSMLLSPTLEVSDAPHWIEMTWERSASELRPMGYVRVWVDGNDAGRLELVDLDNDAIPLTAVRIGAVLGAASGASGSVLVDEITLWREN